MGVASPSFPDPPLCEGVGGSRSAACRFDGVVVYDRRYLNPTQFIDAIAPTDEGFSRIHREQYSICVLNSHKKCRAELTVELVFRVADGSRRGLVSYEDFVVFETCSLLSSSAAC